MRCKTYCYELTEMNFHFAIVVQLEELFCLLEEFVLLKNSVLRFQVGSPLNELYPHCIVHDRT